MELKVAKQNKIYGRHLLANLKHVTNILSFASKAKKDGYVQIAKIFEETAANEKEHAKIWFKLVDNIGTTEENLKAAAAGEHEEWTSMYPEFAKVAREEGFTRIANLFEMVAKIEKEHDERYNILLANIQEDKVFKRNEKNDLDVF